MRSLSAAAAAASPQKKVFGGTEYKNFLSFSPRAVSFSSPVSQTLCRKVFVLFFQSFFFMAPPPPPSSSPYLGAGGFVSRTFLEEKKRGKGRIMSGRARSKRGTISVSIWKIPKITTSLFRCCGNNKCAVVITVACQRRLFTTFLSPPPSWLHLRPKSTSAAASEAMVDDVGKKSGMREPWVKNRHSTVHR